MAKGFLERDFRSERRIKVDSGHRFLNRPRPDRRNRALDPLKRAVMGAVQVFVRMGGGGGGHCSSEVVSIRFGNVRPDDTCGGASASTHVVHGAVIHVVGGFHNSVELEDVGGSGIREAIGNEAKVRRFGGGVSFGAARGAFVGRLGGARHGEGRPFRLRVLRGGGRAGGLGGGRVCFGERSGEGASRGFLFLGLRCRGVSGVGYIRSEVVRGPLRSVWRGFIEKDDTI